MMWKRSISSLEVVRAHLARLQAANPAVNAVVVDLGAAALRAARRADRALAARGAIGPLHGVPVTVKQNVDVKGEATANGVPAQANLVAPDDAPVVANLRRAGAIITEATLSFLGLGTQPPTPSWGSMLNAAQQYLTQAPWLSIWPGVAIAVTVFAVNVAGDGIREIWDPRTR